MTRDVHRSPKLALIGVPSSAGARMAGQEQAPRRLRDAGLVQSLVSSGFDVTDMGNLTTVPFSPDTKNPKQQNLQSVLAVLREVADAVDKAIESHAWPLVIGGDCTVTIGVLAALIDHYPNLGLAYLDGDVDLNTPETTHTGIFDGMVMAHIVGRGVTELKEIGARCPLLEEQQIALFGYSVEAGGVDPAEIDLLKHAGMAKYPLDEIDDDIQAAARSAAHKLEKSTSHFLVHFDVDVIDHEDFPAADVPHKPGLTFSQATDALSVFAGNPKAVGLVVTEFNADQDLDGTLALKLAGAIKVAMASRL